MRISTLKSLLLAGMTGFSAMASPAAPADGRIDLDAFRYRTHQRCALNKMRQNPGLLSEQVVPSQSAPSQDYLPAVTLGPSTYTGDLDGPDGKLWYYTADLDYEVLPADPDAGIFYQEKILRAYSYTIYDPDFQLVGVVKAPMEYQEGERRVVAIEIAPVVSRNFFNSDDRLEVMIALSINTEIQGENNYRTLVYSVGGDTTPEGYDKPVHMMSDLLVDVVEGPRKADGSDNFYMTFLADYYPDNLDSEDITFWDYLTAARMDMTIYGSAVDDNGPRVVAERSLPLLNLPGDQESAPFIMSLCRDNDVYFVFSGLQEPLWEEYNDPIMDEMVQRASNKLNIEFFKVEDGALTHVYTTAIDVARDDEDDMTIASFFSVGSMRYKQDMIFDAPGVPEGKAWLIVTRENYNPASDNSSMSYFLYDHEGNCMRTLADYCDSSVALSDIDGFEPQQVFISRESLGYGLSFVDILSGKERFWTSSLYDMEDADPEAIMANIDRVPFGDSYKYCVELSSPVEIDGLTYMRVLWLDSRGIFDRIDMVNAGENVLYGQFYIARDALRPDAFYGDDEHEYLILVKRGVPGEQLTEELMVVQPKSDINPEGNTLLHLLPGEFGALSGIIPDLEGDEHRMVVYYNRPNEDGTNSFTQQIYRLPLELNESGVNDIVAGGAEGVLKVNGTVIEAEGEICVYSVAGALMARGDSTVDLAEIGKGLYIAVASGKSVKVLVK